MHYGRVIDGHTIRFERTLPCSLDLAWGYLTQPGRLATWLAEGSIELRVGGRVKLNFDVEEVPEREEGGAIIYGLVTLCVPQRVLAYTWTDNEDDLDRVEPISAVTFELAPQNSHTLLILTHKHLPPEAVAGCGAGWHTHLDVLAARLQNHPPEPFLTTWKRLLPLYEERATAFIGRR